MSEDDDIKPEVEDDSEDDRVEKNVPDDACDEAEPASVEESKAVIVISSNQILLLPGALLAVQLTSSATVPAVALLAGISKVNADHVAVLGTNPPATTASFHRTLTRQPEYDVLQNSSLYAVSTFMVTVCCRTAVHGRL
jgi:hypothetical protein